MTEKVADKGLILSKEQRDTISMISIQFDNWLESLGPNYSDASEFLGHSILDLQEMLDKLYWLPVEEEH